MSVCVSVCGVQCQMSIYLLGDWVDQLSGRAVVDIHLTTILIPEWSTDSHICAGTSQYTLTEQQYTIYTPNMSYTVDIYRILSRNI